MSKALRDDNDLKMRASSFGSVVVWPGDEGSVDENSVKANYGLIKHVPPAYRLCKDVLTIPTLKWIMVAVAECWEASLVWACIHMKNECVSTDVCMPLFVIFSFCYSTPVFIFPAKSPPLKVNMSDTKCKGDAWSIKKMSNHVTRLRSRADKQRYREIHELAETLQAI